MHLKLFIYLLKLLTVIPEPWTFLLFCNALSWGPERNASSYSNVLFTCVCECLSKAQMGIKKSKPCKLLVKVVQIQDKLKCKTRNISEEWNKNLMSQVALIAQRNYISTKLRCSWKIFHELRDCWIVEMVAVIETSLTGLFEASLNLKLNLNFWNSFRKV